MNLVKKMVHPGILVSVVFVSSCLDSSGDNQQYSPPELSIPSFLPDAPPGFEWKMLNDLSDEFDGDALDNSKWRDHITTWRGRPPAEFLRDNVSVKNGNLELKTSTHPNPSEKFTMGGAAVSGRYDIIYGYFEARIKASKTKMSTTFWLHSDEPDDAHLGCVKRHSSELDILETIGGWPEPVWANIMRSNTHYKPTTMVDGRCRTGDYLSKGVQLDTGDKLSAEFNTYSMWWVTPNQMHFYFNGEPTGSVNLNHAQDQLPFNSKMSLRMVVETYTWQQKIVPEGEQPYPNKEELDNPDINVAYYDHVRSYRLKSSKDNLIKSAGFESQQRDKDWVLSSNGAAFSSEPFNSYTESWGLQVAGGGRASQSVNVEPNDHYVFHAYAKNQNEKSASKLVVYDQHRNVIASLAIDSLTFRPYRLEFDSGKNSQLTVAIEATGSGQSVVDNLALTRQQ